MTEETLFFKFKQRAEAINAEVYRLSNKHDAIDFITDFIKKEGFPPTLWADTNLLKAQDKRVIAEKVSNLSFDINRQSASEAKIGISQMDWAIANTGTLAHDATSVEQRLVSMLTEIHIAIIQTSKLLPDLPSVLSHLDAKEIPFLAFITGPSRTADIERVLTIGVHGPERLIIVFIDNLED